MRQQSIAARRLKRHSESVRAPRSGTTLVEFALVAPLLFFFLFLFVEFDRYVVTVHALKEATRVGCRVAILEGSTLEDVEVTVDEILSPFGIDKYTVSVTPDLNTSIESGDPISVEIDVAYDDVSWAPSPKFLEGKTISVAATLPKEK